MDSTLATRQELRSLEQKIEEKLMRLEVENFRLHMDQRFTAFERNVTFWLGLMLVAGLGTLIVLVRHWA